MRRLIVTAAMLGGLLLAGCGANSAPNAGPAAPGATKAPASADTAAVKQLVAEAYVTAKDYQHATSVGELDKAAKDLSTLQGKCDTGALLIKPGAAGAQTDVLRGLCQSIGDPIP